MNLWNDVVKRIDGLIKQNLYLNEEEKAEIENMKITPEHNTDTLINAMNAAGYEYNEIESYEGYLVFNGEGVAATFNNWKETEEWLDGVVFDDPTISNKVERILYPDRFESESIKDWYVEKYPTDDLGPNINSDITFDDILVSLDTHEDVYETIGVGDSIVRERIFAEISERQGIPYDEIYDKWLDAGRENKCVQIDHILPDDAVARTKPSVLKKLEEKKSEIAADTSHTFIHDPIEK